MEHYTRKSEEHNTKGKAVEIQNSYVRASDEDTLFLLEHLKSKGIVCVFNLDQTPPSFSFRKAKFCVRTNRMIRYCNQLFPEYLPA